jgi:hypothetical protein
MRAYVIYGSREAMFLRGDCDGNGRIAGEVSDAIRLLSYNYLGGEEPPCLAACDADGDGTVAGLVTDAIFLLTHNFLGGPGPMEPFPGCGVGTPSDEALGCVSTSVSCR